MKTAIARTSIECWVDCPYCDSYQDRFDDLKEHYVNGEPRADECEAEIVCEDCKERFVVTSIQY